MRAPVGLPLPREVLGEFGIYVHVPFCAHRCFYCDFNAYAGLDHLASGYMRALARDAREALAAPDGFAFTERPTVTSVFVGGGTPSLVAAGDLVEVLEGIRDAWPVSPDVEITVECNPESADPDKLEAYLRAGVRRLSFGVQTLEDGLLASLGRLHDSEGALAALRAARRVGFDSVNADLIFGVPGETDEAWLRSLDGVIDAGATHVSCYGLTYEEGTPLHAWRRLGKVRPVPDDDVAHRWELASGRLGDAGFGRYEISNWALPGEESRHNRLYWACGEYLGCGAGAHSHLALPEVTWRSWTLKAPDRYTEAIGSGERPILDREAIDLAGRASEVMFLGLRRVEGVHETQFRALTGLELESVFGPQIEEGVEQGLLEWREGTVRLTEAGTLLANVAVSPFLEADVECERVHA